MRAAAALFTLLIVGAGPATLQAQTLARARALYNSANYDAAISAAEGLRTQPAIADAAALVQARAHLDRYRINGDAADLSSARDALSAVRPGMMAPRDQVDFFVGVAQSLYFTNEFGAAADLFHTALERDAMLSHRDRMQLLDWWATALDREAQASTPERRVRIAAQLSARMQEELRMDPGSAPANYWLAVAAREAGDGEAAWDAAVAAWVRGAYGLYTTQIRTDIDRLMTQAIIPQRVRSRPAREQVDATEALLAEWETIKQQWK